MSARPEPHELVNETRGTILATDARFALDRRARTRGLLGRESLEHGEALVFPRCRQVHMFGMRFSIDVLFLDGEGVVVRAVGDLQPGRLSPWVRSACTVVELPAGTLESTGTHKGDRVVFTPLICGCRRGVPSLTDFESSSGGR
jgi:uncharacterized membrane protein (UPF0127 family)